MRERLGWGELKCDTCFSNQALLPGPAHPPRLRRRKNTVTPDGSLFEFKAPLGLLRESHRAHTGDNGITSSVQRVIALDSDERGMRRNTFSFPLRRKQRGGGWRGSSEGGLGLPGTSGVCQGSAAELG